MMKFPLSIQSASAARNRRMAVEIRGAVQGVGFRPFVYRLATEMGLTGWVCNSEQGVVIEAEGTQASLERFLARIREEKPPHALIRSMESSRLDPVFDTAFEIRPSLRSGGKTSPILPDLATCPDCLREIFDPANRRHLYPFTNCTNCGPRFSIVESLPYDRARTTMKRFTMCGRCRREYDDPADRRFHAEPNACPICGPRLELWDPNGKTLSQQHEALLQAAAAIREGGIVALKGLGGFHLIADARNDAAVARLRERKRRPEKPLALMFPSIASIKKVCRISGPEERLLRASEAPIVLLRRRPDASPAGIGPSVSPANPDIGAMLPYTPLHHILLRALGFPVVATSGNRSDEPICTDEREAVQCLEGIADLFLVHDRWILRHVDDSIVRVVAGREQILRRARGYAPLPIEHPASSSTILALGGELKNSVALADGGNVFISQHLGDLATEEAFRAFERVVGDAERLYDLIPSHIACDLHPDYLSTGYAKRTCLPVIPIQHHHAHVVSCMAENGVEGTVLGIAWDGAGYGTDGTIWGGEFLVATASAFERAGHFRTFPLPGGERAIREPRRAAIGLLCEVFGEEALARDDLSPVRSFSKGERVILRQMLKQGVNAPRTSSVGRIFDAIASILGLSQTTSFEGQGAMAVEFALEGIETDEAYPFGLDDAKAGAQAEAAWTVDWTPMVRDLCDDMNQRVSDGKIAAKFHNTLVEIIVSVAKRLGEKIVVLTGGCFQNRVLTERAVRRLEAEGFSPYWHRRVPPNDGGIALGQAVIASHRTIE
jgi:hydrogenase maturation protein HypF